MEGILLFPYEGSNNNKNNPFYLFKYCLCTLSDFSFFTFSYLLLYFYFLGVAVFEDIMKFELNLFWQGEYLKILVYYFISIFSI